MRIARRRDKSRDLLLFERNFGWNESAVKFASDHLKVINHWHTNWRLAVLRFRPSHDLDFPAQESMSATSTPRDSKKFPAGYGDFPLQCNDDIVCHFPRHLLEYMSPVFKDMFYVSNRGEDGRRSMSPYQPPNLLVTEPSATIELLLQHIDPKMKTPDLDPTTIVNLLEAARKYQVSSITEWFEEEVQLKRGFMYIFSGGSEPCLAKNPMLVYYCAVQFDLPGPGRLALKELCRCDAKQLSLVNRDLPLRAYLHCMTLRTQRIDLFKGFISKLTELRHEFKFVTETSGSRRSVRDPLYFNDKDRSTCASCTAVRASWVFKLECTIRERPCWDNFIAVYDSSGERCVRCSTQSWADTYRDFLKDWETAAKRAEQELPSWPF